MATQKNKHLNRTVGIAVVVIAIILIGATAGFSDDLLTSKRDNSSPASTPPSDTPLQISEPTPSLTPAPSLSPSGATIAAQTSNPSKYINASAGNGGTITPSGLVGVSVGGSQQFSINANTGEKISSLSVDGINTYVANYTFAQKPPVNTGDTNEKVVMVNNQRFILTNAYTYSNFTANINIYLADANWNPVSLVSISPDGDTAKDFYVMNFSSSFPDTILICGATSSLFNYSEGFIASYNVISGAWHWVLQPNSQYLTNILNPYGGTIFIQSSTKFANQCFYATIVSNLFTPSSWATIDEPNAEWEGRIAYFNGDIYCLQCSSGLSWTLNEYNIATSAWNTYPLMSYTDTTGFPLSDIFPYIWADSTEVLFSAPMPGAMWNLYYSTDGATFYLITSISAVGGFNYTNGCESHCWANDIGNGLIAVSNTQDDNPEGYIVIMTLQGVIINEGGNCTSHDTGARFLFDGNYLVTGAEDCAQDPSNSMGIKTNNSQYFTYKLHLHVH